MQNVEELKKCIEGKQLSIRRYEEILNNHPEFKDYTDESGKTTIYRATKFRNGHLVQALLNSGVDVNTKNQDGETALSSFGKFHVFNESDYNIFNILLNNGADLFAKRGKSTVLSVGNYRKYMRMPFEDLDLELRILKKYNIIYNIQEPLLLYRKDRKSTRLNSSH